MEGLSAASSVVSLAVIVFQMAKSLRDKIKLVRLCRQPISSLLPF